MFYATREATSASPLARSVGTLILGKGGNWYAVSDRASRKLWRTFATEAEAAKHGEPYPA